MTTIGITGAGYSGLTLALRLQQLGIDTTVYVEATPDAMRSGRLPNTVGRFGTTVARERSLGIDDDPGPDAHDHRHPVPGRTAGRPGLRGSLHDGAPGDGLPAAAARDARALLGATAVASS